MNTAVAALAGRGIALRSEWDVAPLIAAGRLVRVLPAYTLPEAPVVALVPARRGISARSRAFSRRFNSPFPNRA